MSTSYYSVLSFSECSERTASSDRPRGYRISGDGCWRRSNPIEIVASGLGLIPKSMATRARLKRLMHRDMPMLTGIQEGMADLLIWLP